MDRPRGYVARESELGRAAKGKRWCVMVADREGDMYRCVGTYRTQREAYAALRVALTREATNG